MTDGSGRPRRLNARIAIVLVIAAAILLIVPLASTSAQLFSWTHPAGGSPSSAAGAVSACAVGSSPDGMAYDPANHYVYAPNRFSGNLSILDGCSVVATITFPGGSELVQAGFDPVNNFVYVTDQALDQVYVISGTTLLETLSSPSFDGPFGVAFDPGDGAMAISNDDSNTVTFMSGSTVLFTVTVGSNPTVFAYDPLHARLLVVNYGSDNVTSMSALDPGVAADNVNIPVGLEPIGIAYDVANALDYVANSGSGNLSLISGAGGQYGSLPVGPGPRLVVWDQSDLTIDVTLYSPGTVSAIQGHGVVRTIAGPVGATFSGIVYDDATGQLYVGGWNTAEVYIYP